MGVSAPSRIVVNKPFVAPNALPYIGQALKNEWLSPGGPMAQAFAEKLGEYVGGSAVLVNSGTSALEMAIRATARVYGLSGGSIIVPSYTCPDCAIAVIKAGFKPVFADVHPDRLCLTVESIEAVMEWVKDVVGVMVIHLYGMTPALDVYQLARSRGIFIVDDVAEGIGVRPGGYNLLDLTDVAITSLRGEKPLPTGTGGVVMTRHEGIKGLAESMVGLNSPGGFNRYYSFDMAYSYEYPELLAALGLAQLEVYPGMVQERRALAQTYREMGVGHSFDLTTDIPWKLPVRVADSRKAWETAKKHGVEVSPPHWPLHQLPFLRGYHHDAAPTSGKRWSLAVSEKLRGKLVAFPLWPGMTPEQVGRVVEVIKLVV